MLIYRGTYFWPVCGIGVPYVSRTLKCISVSRTQVCFHRVNEMCVLSQCS